MELQRTIGAWGLLLIAAGGIVGSGWLFGPFFAAKVAGPAAIVSWALGGGLMMLIAMTFAELSSTFPVAGGTVRFIHLSHGPLASFSLGWMNWLAAVSVAPIETMAMIQYATNYFPALMYQSGSHHLLTGLGFSVAALIMLLMCIINVFSVRLLAKSNVAIMIFKLSIPVLTIGVLLSVDFHVKNFVDHGFAPMGLKGILTALPLAGVIFSFLGYSAAIQLAGEAKNPQRTIPFALIGALLICIVLYSLLQFVFIAAVAPSDLAQGWHVLDFKGDVGPFAGIAMAVGVVWLAHVLFVDAVVSPLGTGLIYTASTARLCYAMGENGYLPKPLSKLNRLGVPARIIALHFCVGMILLLPFPNWEKLVGFLVSALVLAIAVGPLSLLVLRKTLSEQKRPFRLPVARFLCPMAFYFCNLIIFWAGWATISKMLIAIIIGYVFFALFRLTRQGRQLNLEWGKSWWVFLYFSCLGLMSYLGTFGGGQGIIPFGWDFLVMAVMSGIIFEISLWSGLKKYNESR